LLAARLHVHEPQYAAQDPSFGYHI
jgi:hypothetical protein